MDSQSSWLTDARQLSSSSFTGLNYDLDDFFDAEELWDSFGDLSYPINDVENVQHDAPADQVSASQHEFDVFGMVQPCAVDSTADANSNVHTDIFSKFQPWGANYTANPDSNGDIDIFGMSQTWGMPDTTNPVPDSGIATIPLADFSHRAFQHVDVPTMFPSNQETTSQHVQTSNGVSAEECYSGYGSQTQYLAPEQICLVGDYNFNAQATNDWGIIGSSAQANQCGPFLENGSTHFPQEPPAERTISSPNVADPLSFDCPSNSLTQRKQPRIPESARKFLEQQFLMNAYPTPAEIDALSVLTKQEPPRIKNWFSNARARRPVPEGKEPGHATVRLKLSQESLEKLASEAFSGQQPPLDAYLASSIADEPAQVLHIEAALASTESQDVGEQGPSKLPRLGTVLKRQSPPKRLQHRAPRSAASSRSTAETNSTQNSQNSQGSGRSSTSRGRRRGRKRFNSNGTMAIGGHKPGFHCTFCWKTFKNWYEWDRHESSVHVQNRSWVCCLSEIADSCPFCNVSNPDAAHLASHDYFTCMEKPEESRTFYRKDQFFQHIMNTHCREPPEEDPRVGEPVEPVIGHCLRTLAKAWDKAQAPFQDDHPVLHCGFCGQRLRDWTHRSDHIAGHYTEARDDNNYYGQLDWWPQRLPALVMDTPVGHSDLPSLCLICLKYISLPSTHDLRMAWSCSFLRSCLSFFEKGIDFPRCLLCNQRQKGKGSLYHCETHRYRECKQEIYHSWEQMIEHLKDFHNAEAVDDPSHLTDKPLRLQCSGYVCAADPGFSEGGSGIARDSVL